MSRENEIFFNLKNFVFYNSLDKLLKRNLFMDRRKILKSAMYGPLLYGLTKFDFFEANANDFSKQNIITGICNETKANFIDNIECFEKYMNYRHDVIQYFSMFDYRKDPDMVVPFFTTIPTTIWNSGKIPLITWYPSTSNIEPTPKDICKKIYTGKFDNYLERCCTAILNYLSNTTPNLNFGKPKILIRFAHEMNIHYRLYSNPSDFKKMWCYVFKFFRDRGLNKDRVLFIFSPNSIDLNTRPFEEYFPGDDFIDWNGVDGYNWGGKGDWVSFADIFEPAMKRIRKISKKPLSICEFGTTAKTDKGEDNIRKHNWIKDAFKWIEKQENLKKYNLKMAIYFNINKINDIDSGIYPDEICNVVNLNSNQINKMERLKDIYFKNLGYSNFNRKLPENFFYEECELESIAK